MAAVALEDVVKQLQLNKKSTDDVMKTLKEWLQMQKNAMLDNLEKEREQKSDKKKDKARERQGGGKGGTKVNFWGNLLNPKFWMKGLIAIPAALTALVAGLAGWRIGWFKALTGTLKALGKISKAIFSPLLLLKPIRLLRNAIFKMFGLRVQGGARGWNFKGLSGAQKQSGVFGQIVNKFRGFMNILMKAFRGGGKKNIKLPKGFGGVFKIFGGLLRGLFSGIKGVGVIVGGLMKPFMPFLKFGGRLFGTVFKKILWPLSIIFGAFAGVKAYMSSTESTFIGKFGDFVGGFMGDFIGMPLALLRDVVNWLMKKIMPGAVNADGTWDTSKGIGKFMEKFSNFPVVQWITDAYSLPFKILEDVFLVLQSYFETDPRKAAQGPWGDLLRRNGINPYSKTPVNDLFFSWVDKAFRWMAGWFVGPNWKEANKDFSITTLIGDINHTINEWFRMLIPNMMLDMKKDWNRVETQFKIDMLSFGNFFSKIPKLALLLSAAATVGPLDRLLGLGLKEQISELWNREVPDGNAKVKQLKLEKLMNDTAAWNHWMDIKYGHSNNLDTANNRNNPEYIQPMNTDNSTKVTINMINEKDVAVFNNHTLDYFANRKAVAEGGGMLSAAQAQQHYGTPGYVP